MTMASRVAVEVEVGEGLVRLYRLISQGRRANDNLAVPAGSLGKFAHVPQETPSRARKVSVRRSANRTGEPSAVTSTASASSIRSTRAVWRRRFLGAFAATILSEPPGTGGEGSCFDPHGAQAHAKARRSPCSLDSQPLSGASTGSARGRWRR